MKCVGSDYRCGIYVFGIVSLWTGKWVSAHAGMMKNVMGTIRCFPSQLPRGRGAGEVSGHSFALILAVP